MLRKIYSKYKYFKKKKNEANELFFYGNYSCWDEAIAESSKYGNAYQNIDIVNKVEDALQKVRNGEAVFERDGLIFLEEEYDLEFAATLLYAYKELGKLVVLDFGGSLGSTYFQYKKILNGIDLNWNIIEQESFAKIGLEKIPEIKFFSNINELSNDIDIILFGASLEYLEDMYSTLEMCMSKRPRFFVFDRTPFSVDDNDRICVQHVPASIYKAVYPVHILSQTRLEEFMKEYGYKRLFSWGANWESIPIFEEKEEIPTKCLGLMFEKER